MRESSYIKGIETMKSDFTKKVLKFIILGGSSVFNFIMMEKLVFRKRSW